MGLGEKETVRGKSAASNVGNLILDGRICVLEWAGRVVSGSGVVDYFSNFQDSLLVWEMREWKDISLP